MLTKFTPYTKSEDLSLSFTNQLKTHHAHTKIGEHIDNRKISRTKKRKSIKYHT